jgi:uncharacterized small protein (DUF1192 family)
MPELVETNGKKAIRGSVEFPNYDHNGTATIDVRLKFTGREAEAIVNHMEQEKRLPGQWIDQIATYTVESLKSVRGLKARIAELENEVDELKMEREDHCCVTHLKL